ncbi:MAG TPA: hypothetical protein VLG76_05135 [Rhabdochlamydiaceae bacterium]|nr:hypothetical protein [Rhabdochlamydiaceae bacterium]
MHVIPLLFALVFGNKSLDMFSELEKGALLEYDCEKKLFLHNQKTYHILTGKLENVSSKPLIYIGSYPLGREILCFDPAASPLLEGHYASFISLIPKNSTVIELLSLMTSYIRNAVFSMERCKESTLNAFIYDWVHDKKRTDSDFTPTNKNFYLPLISIEEFIQSKIGVCRQLAFVSTYFLDRLIDSKLLVGKAYFVRDLVSARHRSGGHAWSLFIDAEGDAWHIDPLWNVIYNLTDPSQYEILCNLYGTLAMQRQLQRLLEK